MSVSIPISIGELWDKFSILKIKEEKIQDKQKRNQIEKEVSALEPFMNPYLNHNCFLQLKEVNEKLWTIEDNIRIKERDKQFDGEFIQLARSVYKVNDTRAEIKHNINLTFDSILSEVKEYITYDYVKIEE
jgi:hypothetical protein